MRVEEIARVCHEVNRAYCESIGDTSQVPWDRVTEWQRESAIEGVLFHINNPGASPWASHENWLKGKVAAGWKWGVVKDENKKEHPCCVPFDELPMEQRSKDYIFGAIVRVLTEGGIPVPIVLPIMPLPMNKYEIINPSDKCYLWAGEEIVISAAVLILGHGQYMVRGLDGGSLPTCFIMGGNPDEAFRERFGISFTEFMIKGENLRKVADCYSTFEYEGERTSMNDIGARAKALEKRYREVAEEVVKKSGV